MISSHRIPPMAILCIFIGASTSLDMGTGVDKESKKKCHRKEGVQLKKWFSSHKFYYVPFPVTQYFLLGFLWDYSEQQKKHIQEIAYQCIWNKKLKITT